MASNLLVYMLYSHADGWKTEAVTCLNSLLWFLVSFSLRRGHRDKLERTR